MIKTALIGAGYLGKFHAEKISHSNRATLHSVCDLDSQLAETIASTYNAIPVLDYRQIPADIDAVHIVTPTQSHFEIARFFLNKGTHVLLEKPITQTLNEAETLIEISQSRNVVLQIGHVERFNTAVEKLNQLITRPIFIECTRIAPFKNRGLDVDIVLDLMIHDLDIIQSAVKSEISEIRAAGTPVISENVDIANARIQFQNGCIANITASRVSVFEERKIRVFCPEQYLSADLSKKTVTRALRDKQTNSPHPSVLNEKFHCDQNDALSDQIESFYRSIKQRSTPRVTGTDAYNALKTAEEIGAVIRNQMCMQQEDQ